MPIHSRKRSRLCLPPPSSGRFLVRWRSCGDPELRPWRPSVSRDLDADWGTGRSGRNPHEGGEARTEWAGLVEGGRSLRFRVGPNDDPPLPPAMFFRLLGFVGWGDALLRRLLCRAFGNLWTRSFTDRIYFLSFVRPVWPFCSRSFATCFLGTKLAELFFFFSFRFSRGHVLTRVSPILNPSRRLRTLRVERRPRRRASPPLRPREKRKLPFGHCGNAFGASMHRGHSSWTLVCNLFPLCYVS